jgi:hypothetical protein
MSCRFLLPPTFFTRRVGCENGRSVGGPRCSAGPMQNVGAKVVERRRAHHGQQNCGVKNTGRFQLQTTIACGHGLAQLSRDKETQTERQ